MICSHLTLFLISLYFIFWLASFSLLLWYRVTHLLSYVKILNYYSMIWIFIWLNMIVSRIMPFRRHYLYLGQMEKNLHFVTLIFIWLSKAFIPLGCLFGQTLHKWLYIFCWRLVLGFVWVFNVWFNQYVHKFILKFLNQFKTTATNVPS